MKTYKEAIENFTESKQTLPSKTAFQQYCRKEKNMTYQAISDLTGTGKQEVWNRCNGEYTIRSFENITYSELISCENLYNLIFN